MNSPASRVAAVCCAVFLFVPPFALATDLCQDFGPQAPRDITSAEGTNPVTFAPAPPSAELNLCNVHFHKNAEHRGHGYMESAGTGEFGGFRCDGGGEHGGADDAKACHNVHAGDTIEVHWVYTSCDVTVEPGKGLGACSSASCANPQLRVEAQVYRVVGGDGGAGLPGAAPTDGPPPVSYAGSTTGSKYSASICSSLQVTWSVRPECREISLGQLASWCATNPYDEQHAHGVRPLVVDLPLLSQIP